MSPHPSTPSSTEGEHPYAQLKLSDALAISGAAISPTALAKGPLRWLLSAFNLRTGLWLYGADVNHWMARHDLVFPWQIFRQWVLEMDQASRPTKQSTQASVGPLEVATAVDGGYYEFLGIEELLHRRCRLIIVSDSGRNEENEEFEALANLVRSVRVRFGIEVLDLDDDRPLDLERLRRDKESRMSPQHYVMGRIRYPDDPNEAVLLYVQMNMTGDEDVDLLQYHRVHKSFPGEPTSNQFFDETLVQSFRQLGFHVGERICREVPDQGHKQTTASFTIADLISHLIDGYALEGGREGKVDRKDFLSRLAFDYLKAADKESIQNAEAALFDFERNKNNKRTEIWSLLDREPPTLFTYPNPDEIAYEIACGAVALNQRRTRERSAGLRLFQIGGRRRLLRAAVALTPDREESTDPSDLPPLRPIMELAESVFRECGPETAVDLLRLWFLPTERSDHPEFERLFSSQRESMLEAIKNLSTRDLEALLTTLRETPAPERQALDRPSERLDPGSPLEHPSRVHNRPEGSQVSSGPEAGPERGKPRLDGPGLHPGQGGP